MKFQLVNKKNIRKFLKTRKDNKWYFRFPWLKGKKTLIVEIEGVIRYWGKLLHREAVLDAAWEAYRKRLRKDRRDEKT